MVVVDVASPCADVYAYVIGSSCVRVPDRGTRGAVIANELPFLGATGFCEHLVLDVDALARKGVYCEHTTAANYAAYLEYRRLNGPTPDTLLTMCGAGLKSDH